LAPRADRYSYFFVRDFIRVLQGEIRWQDIAKLAGINPAKEMADWIDLVKRLEARPVR
jgi:hypothetical protein